MRYGPEGGITGPLQKLFASKLRFKGDDRTRADYFTLIGTIGGSLEHAFVIGAGPLDFISPASGELGSFANEVLACIAFKQPISQAEIDRLFDAAKRGIVVTLRDLKLVEEFRWRQWFSCGREAEPLRHSSRTR